MSTRYVIPPPDVPEFLYGTYESAWRDLIYWAKREHIARLRYCADHGYIKEFRRQQREWSPVRILAELSGFRRYCGILQKRGRRIWKNFFREEQDFLISCLKLRDLLKRDTP